MQPVVRGISANVSTPAEDFCFFSANEWETDVNAADASNVMGHLCQDCLQLSTVDCGPRLESSRSGLVHMRVK